MEDYINFCIQIYNRNCTKEKLDTATITSMSETYFFQKLS